MSCLRPTAEREKSFLNSPFALFAKEEGFGLWAVNSSYFLLQSMLHMEENYYDMANSLAITSPEHAEPLYKILRAGMHENTKNHVNILYAITNVTTKAIEFR